ncbi:MAG: DUF1565 domain-containing protein [Desulfobacteraceae bacterium]|nr:DUF1565 domain-containing protein [Desulfobacteraceae bacterium]
MNFRYLLLIPVIFYVSICYGADYYVANTKNCSNSGTGTIAEPWCTIQKAAQTAVAGDNVYVKAGNYSENVKFKNSGSASRGYITFQNFEKDKVSLDPGSFELENISYLKVIGFHIKNPPGERSGIEIGGTGSYVQIRNNEITGCVNLDTAAVRAGDYMHHFIIDGNHIHHNNTGTQEGLRIMEHTHDFKVTNNKVDHNTNIGIDIVGWAQYGKPYNGLVRGNLCHNNSLKAPWSAGIYLDSPNNIIVEYNVSWGNARGLEMGCENRKDQSSGNIMRYNIVYENHGRGLSVGGYQGGLVHDCEVYNNIFYNNGGAEIGFDSNPGKNNKFYNNILYDPGTALICNAGNKNIFKYNCYFGKGGLGSNNITADPLFVNQAKYDFRLKPASPCIDAGDPQTAKTIGYKGNKAPFDGNGDNVPRVDIGPYEYTGIVNSIPAQKNLPKNKLMPKK